MVPCTNLDVIAEVVCPADVPAGDLPLPVERQDEEGGGGHGEGQVEQGPAPDAAVHQLVMGAFTHDIRIEGGGSKVC